MITFASKTNRSSKTANNNANLPRYKKGWVDSKGNAKAGFWYLFHDGRKVALTRYGAPSEKGGKAEFNLAIAARDSFLSNLATTQAETEATTEAPSVPTVVDVCNYYAANHCPTQSPKTRSENERFLRVFATGCDSGKGGTLAYRGFGALLATELTQGHLDQWQQAHPRWVDAKPYKVVKAAFAYAHKKGLIDSNPLVGYAVAKGKRREAIFTVEDEKTFRAAITNRAFATFFAANIELGTRPGELATLTPKHVVENGGNLFFVLQPAEWKCGKKTNRPRIIALTPKWQQWTRTRLAEINGRNQHLFHNSVGSPWESRVWGEAFQLALNRTELNPALTLYSARHTFITRKVAEGIPLAHIARATGTSVAEIERVYDKTYGDFALMASVIK